MKEYQDGEVVWLFIDGIGDVETTYRKSINQFVAINEDGTEWDAGTPEYWENPPHGMNRILTGPPDYTI